jgi:hypothetical protein
VALGDLPDLTLLTAKGRELVNDKVSHLGAVVLDNLVRLTGRSQEEVPREPAALTTWVADRTRELHEGG